MMGRRPSKITKISGRLYRVTPYDPAAERHRRAWDKRHLVTVATKLPRQDFAALVCRCQAAGVTMYAYLRALLAADQEDDLVLSMISRSGEGVTRTP